AGGCGGRGGGGGRGRPPRAPPRGGGGGGGGAGASPRFSTLRFAETPPHPTSFAYARMSTSPRKRGEVPAPRRKSRLPHNGPRWKLIPSQAHPRPPLKRRLDQGRNLMTRRSSRRHLLMLGTLGTLSTLLPA